MPSPSSSQRALRAAAVVLLLASGLAAQVPTGFVDEQVAGGFSTPVGLAFLPDGRVLVVEQFTGAVKVAAGASVGTLGIVGPLSAGPEKGLLGIVADPGWPTRPYVYVHYTHATSGMVRISRFDVTGSLSDPASTALALGSEYVIIDDAPDVAPLHNGGTLRFGPDGYLYASLGDDNVPCSAQDPSSLAGQILRMDVEGLPPGGGGPPPRAALIPLGNPFTGPDDNARLVWALGLRNPFRFHIDQATGDVFVTDVGNITEEEVDVVTQGGLNFGWPWYEGTQVVGTCAGVMPPLTPPDIAWNRTSVLGPVSLISLGFYRNPWGAPHVFGPAYEGSYFYLEYYSGVVKRLVHDGTQWGIAPPVAGQPSPTDWALGLGFVADGGVGPDGRLYFVRQVTGDLRAIRPLGAGANPNRTLTILSGNSQVGTSGQLLPVPLRVRLTDLAGLPLAGVPVTFQATPPQGVLGPQPVVTDALGVATTTYTMAAQFSGHPTITASEPGGTLVNFQFIWRGLTALVTNVGANPVLFLQLHHSQTSSPFTIAFDAPGSFPVPVPGGGLVWTSILNPAPSLFALDGLGLVGAPNPFFVTGPSSPSWDLTFSLPPGLGGLVLLTQAYAVDTNLLPLPSAVLISNPQMLFF